MQVRGEELTIPVTMREDSVGLIENLAQLGQPVLPLAAKYIIRFLTEQKHLLGHQSAQATDELSSIVGCPVSPTRHVSHFHR